MLIDVNGIALLFGVLALLMLIRVPITFSLVVSSIITALYLETPLLFIFQKMVNGLDSFTFLAEPFFILPSGASQFEMRNHLIREDLDWSRIEVFHLDEYLGIPNTHNASFRKYLKERFEENVDGLKAFHYIQKDAENIQEEIQRLNALISEEIIDVAFVGIGENAHLAFNDPPADFDTEQPYMIVDLDRKYREQ